MPRTRNELFGALAASGLPYANETWWPQKPPNLPYVLVACEGVSTRQADNRNVMRTTRYRLELYSRGRDYDSESVIADALDGAGISFGMRPIGVIDQTDIYEMQFTTTVVGD